METQKTLTSQNSLGKELSWRKSIKYKADFILYYKDIVIKTVRYWYKIDIQISGTKLRAQK